MCQQRRRLQQGVAVELGALLLFQQQQGRMRA
jgi:hypothetical protein